MTIRNYIPVTLKTRKVGRHRYYYLYWPGPNSKPVRLSLGNIKSISCREAKVLRSRKEVEINEHSSGHDPGKCPKLSVFVDLYLKTRKDELAPGTLELHRQTIKYLIGYFKNDPRIDRITASMARLFKAALAAGNLAFLNKRRTVPATSTVEIHARNARTLFSIAVDDNIITRNPFAKIPKTVKLSKRWHYVSKTDYEKLIAAAGGMNWKLLISICRLAALRRQEALNLTWADIDFERHLIRVVGDQDWQPKNKSSRIIPIDVDLYNLLLEAHSIAPAGQVRVVEGLSKNNIWRDFGKICRRAGVEIYAKPMHTLRKNCITDWARVSPAHVVSQWAGHSDIATTQEHYLQVSELEYIRVSQVKLLEFAQDFAQPDEKTDLCKTKECTKPFSGNELRKA